MKTIGIIGATGQVGTEVCLFLRTFPQVRPLAIARTAVSAVMLQKLGIECRIGTLGDERQCKELLEGCDLVVDFSAALGDVQNTKNHYANNISKALAHSPGNAAYVFISSINAFGMDEQFNRAKHYVIPHSIYAVTKRFGERLAFREGKKHGKAVFVFRLGHVHGLLQRVSRETEDLMQRSSYRAFEYPDTPSYSVFCYSIAEGLVNILDGKEQPGTYVMVSEPAWSWRELLEYYADGKPVEVRLLPPAASPGFLRRASGMLKSTVSELLMKYKNTLRANILHHFPDFEKKHKAGLYVRRAMAQIAGHESLFVFKPKGIHEGTFPGKRLKSLSDSRTSMAEKTAEVNKWLSAFKTVASPSGGAVPSPSGGGLHKIPPPEGDGTAPPEGDATVLKQPLSFKTARSW